MYALSSRLLIVLIIAIFANMIGKIDTETKYSLQDNKGAEFPATSSFNQHIIGAELASSRSRLTLMEVLEHIHLFNNIESSDNASSRLASFSKDYPATSNTPYTVASKDLNIAIEFRSGEELQQRFAAYAPVGHTGEERIYINADWLNSGVGHEWLNQVLLEEYGHALWYRSNQYYELGDHGALFAAETLGWTLSDSHKAAMENEFDWHLITLDGVSVGVHFASFNFSNAYKVFNGSVGGNSFAIDKESNRHHIEFISLNASFIDDERDDRSFSGNDVVTKLEIQGNTYYGWISRPVKAGGVIRGFYFWSDVDFATLQLATADGNSDSDRDVTDNFGFILVVDQAYFDNLAIAGTINGVDYKFVGSSSDPVASALNALIPPNRPPVAVNDVSDLNLAPGTSGGPALEAGGLNNNTAGTNAIGNVLLNDTDPDNDVITLSAVGTASANNVIAAGTTSVNGTSVIGIYGTLTIGANGSYSYAVDNNNIEVQRLRSSSNTLSDVFTYAVKDAQGLQATATLTVITVGANDTPIAADDYNNAKVSLLPGSDPTQYTASDPNGSLALGNVLVNDTDVDGFGENITVQSLNGQFSVQSIAPVGVSSTLRFLGDNGFSSVSAGRTLYFNDNGTFRAIRNSAGDQITIQSIIDLGNSNYDIVLSSPPVNYRTTANDPSTAIAITDFTNLPVGFASSTNDPGPTVGQMKTATVASISQTGFSEIVITPGSKIGIVGVGMNISGDGVPLEAKITEIEYALNGDITKVIVNKTLTSTGGDILTTIAATGVELGIRYGFITISDDGEYVYKPIENNPLLAQGQSAIEVIPYTIADALGAESNATLYITVLGSGSNDPTAKNDSITAVEAGGILNTTAGVNPSGNVLDNDTTPLGANIVVGIRSSSVPAETVVSGLETTVNGLYGTLTIGTDGSFLYVVDNDNLAVQSLRNNDDTFSDVFIYTIENGITFDDEPLQASALLTVTIRGRNDAPVATNDTGVAVQSGFDTSINPGFNPSGNVLSYDTDVDGLSTELRVTAIRTGNSEGAGTAGSVGSTLDGTYGSLLVNANGTWSYMVDSSNLTVKSLSDGESLIEHFNYTVTDLDGIGLSDIAILSITIQGYDDILQINSVVVNEASPFAVFTIKGLVGTEVFLQLGSDVPAGDAVATLGEDFGTTLQYYNGTSWETYNANFPPIIPTGNELLVRVPIFQDDVHEELEAFSLSATATGYANAVGLGVINDEGEGDIYLESNIDGLPNDPTDVGYPVLDDDRPTISVNDITVNEGDFAILTVSIDKISTKEISFIPSLIDGSAEIGTDTADASTLEYSDDGGTEWTVVNGAVVIIPGSTSLKFRIETIDDDLVEGDENFEFNTGIISGTILNTDGVVGVVTIIDNDFEPLTVSSPTVNEGSDWAVFEVSGVAGQLLSLSIDQGSGDGFAELGTTPVIEYWDGSEWVSYTSGDLVSIPAAGPLYVRVNIEAEQDDIFEGAETFVLVATNASGTPAEGTATITDDGTGDYWIGDARTPASEQALADAGILLDDDRAVGVPAKPDVNSTFINELINGTVATNDAVPNSKYSLKSQDPANKDGAEITIFDNGSYQFTAEQPGVYVYFVEIEISTEQGKKISDSRVNQIITYTTRLTITVLDPNGLDNPPVVNTDIAATRMDRQVQIKSLANDRPGSVGRLLVPASVTIVEAAFNGQTSIDLLTGDITYTPNPGFVGEDFFIYQVCDDNTPSQCSTGIQVISVLTLTADNTTLAADDFAYTYSGRPTSGNVLTNDTDPDGDSIVATPAVIESAEGKLILQQDGSFTFTPVQGYAGQFEAVYEICDNGVPVACANATIYVLVNRQLANPDILSGFSGIEMNGNIATNDRVIPSTYYGSPLADASNPAVAQITMNSDGTYTFLSQIPGVYVYTVPVCTNGIEEYCSESILTITVIDPLELNPAPFAQTDLAQTSINTSVTIRTLANDQPGRPGVDLDVASVKIITPPINGLAVVDAATGNITYSPNAGFTGRDMLVYEVCDNSTTAVCAKADQWITVVTQSGFNNTDATDDFYTMTSGDVLQGNLLSNDTDLQGDIQQAVIQNIQGSAGTFNLQADGTFNFSPAPGFYGTAQFTYTVCDNGVPVACASATIYVLVRPPLNNDLFLISGSDQQNFVNVTLPMSLVTEVLNQFGDAVAQANVTYSIVSVPVGTQTISLIDPIDNRVSSGVNATLTIQTDAQGKGYVNLILPNKPGEVVVQASSPALNTVEFLLIAIPDKFEVEQNYPNPLRNSTIIPIYLPEPAITSIQIYDVEGKLIDLPLADQSLDAGLHNITWNASRFASGVYIYRVIARGESGKSYSKTLRLTVIK